MYEHKQHLRCLDTSLRDDSNIRTCSLPPGYSPSCNMVTRDELQKKTIKDLKLYLIETGAVVPQKSGLRKKDYVDLAYEAAQRMAALEAEMVERSLVQPSPMLAEPSAPKHTSPPVRQSPQVPVSARSTVAGRETVADPGVAVVDYNAFTVKALKEELDRRGIRFLAKYRKANLVEILSEDDAKQHQPTQMHPTPEPAITVTSASPTPVRIPTPKSRQPTPKSILKSVRSSPQPAPQARMATPRVLPPKRTADATSPRPRLVSISDTPGGRRLPQSVRQTSWSQKLRDMFQYCIRTVQFVALVAFLAYCYYSVHEYHQNATRPFCDSSSTNLVPKVTDEHNIACKPCPPHALCQQGDVVECVSHRYRLNPATKHCVEDTRVDKDALTMLEYWSEELSRRAGAHDCLEPSNPNYVETPSMTFDELWEFTNAHNMIHFDTPVEKRPFTLTRAKELLLDVDFRSAYGFEWAVFNVSIVSSHPERSLSCSLAIVTGELVQVAKEKAAYLWSRYRLATIATIALLLLTIRIKVSINRRRRRREDEEVISHIADQIDRRLAKGEISEDEVRATIVQTAPEISNVDAAFTRVVANLRDRRHILRSPGMDGQAAVFSHRKRAHIIEERDTDIDTDSDSDRHVAKRLDYS